MSRTNTLIYRISTGLLCLFFIAGAMMYIFNYPQVEGSFINLGFPTWVIYPLAAAKVLGVVAIVTRASTFLKELAYAGFLFDVLLALAAHLMVSDGEQVPAVIALVLIVVSWSFDRKVHGALRQGR